MEATIKIEVYGLDKGLEGSALVGGTGTELQDDTAVTITLTGDQNNHDAYHGEEAYNL